MRVCADILLFNLSRRRCARAPENQFDGALYALSIRISITIASVYLELQTLEVQPLLFRSPSLAPTKGIFRFQSECGERCIASLRVCRVTCSLFCLTSGFRPNLLRKIECGVFVIVAACGHFMHLYIDSSLVPAAERRLRRVHQLNKH